MSRPFIISFGETLWDQFPDGERFGGAPANFACHSAMQGVRVAMVTAVGDDQHGRDAIERLKQCEIETSLVQVVDSPTGTVGVSLDADGIPTFTIHSDAAWDHVAWNDELSGRITEADAVYFGTLGQRGELSKATIRRAMEEARSANVLRMLDINLRSPFFTPELMRESVELASMLKISDEELSEVGPAHGVHSVDHAGDANAMLRELFDETGLEMLVMTRGAQGAVAVTADTMVHQEGIPTNVVDTVGAGDAFAAAFLHSHLQNAPLEQSLKRACEVAAMACSHPGAIPEMD